MGFSFWASGAMAIRKAFYEQRLLTDGIYSVTRNPMYAAFILFLIPAISFLMNDVLIILASVVLYIVFRIKINKEGILPSGTIRRRLPSVCRAGAPVDSPAGERSEISHA